MRGAHGRCRALDRGVSIVRPPGELVVSVRPPTVFADASVNECERLRDLLRGRWGSAMRATVLLSLQALSSSQIAVLVKCDPATVRRWIGRFW